jgi:hypothetical protein
MDIVSRIEALAHASGVFELMNTTWGWPIAESLHFIGLALLLGTVGLVDLRLLGFGRQIELTQLHRSTRWGVVGFLMNVVTGAAFFMSAPDQYLYNPAFQLKAVCLSIAGLNVIAFYAIAWRGVSAARDAVPRIAVVCAAISLCAWVGVIVFGRLITFYRPPEHWCLWCNL